MSSFRVTFPLGNRNEKRKPLFRVPLEAVGIALYETLREEVHYALSLQGAVVLETSYISRGDCFAACKLNCYVRGWKGMSAFLRGLTLPVSSRTMACPQAVRRSRGLLPEDACILPKPPRWNQARRGNGKWQARKFAICESELPVI